MDRSKRRESFTPARGVRKIMVGDNVRLKEEVYPIEIHKIEWANKVFGDLLNEEMRFASFHYIEVKAMTKMRNKRGVPPAYLEEEKIVKMAIPHDHNLKPTALNIQVKLFVIDVHDASIDYTILCIGEFSPKKLHLNTSASRFGIYSNNAKKDYVLFLVDENLNPGNMIWIPGCMFDI